MAFSSLAPDRPTGGRTSRSAPTAALAVAASLVSTLLAGCDQHPGRALAPVEAAAVTALPAGEAAAGRPVRITGRVTYVDGDWRSPCAGRRPGHASRRKVSVDQQKHPFF